MSYYDDFDPREEERQNARLDAAIDDWYDTATKCPNCGHLWQRGYHPATRVDPAYEEQPECPECGWNEGEDPQPEPEPTPEPEQTRGGFTRCSWSSSRQIPTEDQPF